MKKGKLIVIDGSDGSGKATQTKALVQRLEQEGFRVRSLDFPQYEHNLFGKLIADGQCGDFGDWTGLNPRLVSVFYAADRFETAPKLRRWLEDGYVVILDRYVSANQIHQGQKIKDSIERREFLSWLSKMEYDVFQIPKPDMVFFLKVPVAISLENLQKKNQERYKEGRKDQTETDISYLGNSIECAEWLATQDNDWIQIDCTEGDVMKKVEDIHEEIYSKIKDIIS